MATKEGEKMALMVVDKPHGSGPTTKRQLHVLDEDTYLEVRHNGETEVTEHLTFFFNINEGCIYTLPTHV